MWVRTPNNFLSKKWSNMKDEMTTRNFLLSGDKAWKKKKQPVCLTWGTYSLTQLLSDNVSHWQTLAVSNKPVWWIDVNDRTCQNTPSIVRTLFWLLTVTAIKNSLLLGVTLSAVRFTSTRSRIVSDSAIYSSPACFALLSRCFLVNRSLPPD